MPRNPKGKSKAKPKAKATTANKKNVTVRVKQKVNVRVNVKGGAAAPAPVVHAVAAPAPQAPNMFFGGYGGGYGPPPPSQGSHFPWESGAGEGHGHGKGPPRSHHNSGVSVAGSIRAPTVLQPHSDMGLSEVVSSRDKGLMTPSEKVSFLDGFDGANSDAMSIRSEESIPVIAAPPAMVPVKQEQEGPRVRLGSPVSPEPRLAADTPLLKTPLARKPRGLATPSASPWYLNPAQPRSPAAPSPTGMNSHQGPVHLQGAASDQSTRVYQPAIGATSSVASGQSTHPYSLPDEVDMAVPDGGMSVASGTTRPPRLRARTPKPARPAGAESVASNTISRSSAPFLSVPRSRTGVSSIADAAAAKADLVSRIRALTGAASGSTVNMQTPSRAQTLKLGGPSRAQTLQLSGAASGSTVNQQTPSRAQTLKLGGPSRAQTLQLGGQSRAQTVDQKRRTYEPWPNDAPWPPTPAASTRSVTGGKKASKGGSTVTTVKLNGSDAPTRSGSARPAESSASVGNGPARSRSKGGSTATTLNVIGSEAPTVPLKGSTATTVRLNGSHAPTRSVSARPARSEASVGNSPSGSRERERSPVQHGRRMVDRKRMARSTLKGRP